jgi:heterodisulfide reductase subunit B
MEVGYYPGCSLEGLAKSYNESVQAVLKTLGVKPHELKGWTCCGAASAHVVNDDLAVGLAARNLGIADATGLDLVVPCAACFHRLKVAEKHLKQGKPVKGISVKYDGKHSILTVPDFLWERIGEEALRAKVRKPLEGLSPVCYYGCLTARPPKVTDARDHEDPQEMDRVMTALGADVRNWSFKTDCCGGDLTLTFPDLHKKLTQKVLDMAEEAGADCIVVDCPMCHENLDSKQDEISQDAGKSYNVPIYYITELMGLAFGDPGVEKWLSRHTVDPMPLLGEKGLLPAQVRS